MDKWIRAFQIFAKYEALGYDTSVAAEHDEIFAGPNVSVVSKEDIAELDELGWGVNEEFDCFSHYV